MFNFKFRGMVVLILLLIFLTIPACKKEKVRKQEDVKEKIIVAYNTWVGYGPMFISKNKGYYEEEGLEVEFRLMEDSGSKGVALKTGQIQILATTVDSFIIQASQGVKGKIFLGADQSNGGDGIVAVKDVKSLKDLKGRKLGVQPGFVGHFFLLYLLNELGMETKDIEIIPLETGDAGAAFVAGKIDAAVTWEPWLSKAKEKPGAHVLVTSKEKPGIITDVFVATDDWLNDPNKRKILKGFVNAWDKGVRYYREHQEDAVTIIAESFSLSKEEATKMLSGVILMGLSESREYFGTPENPGKIYDVSKVGQKVWFEEGIIKNPITHNIITSELLK